MIMQYVAFHLGHYQSTLQIRTRYAGVVRAHTASYFTLHVTSIVGYKKRTDVSYGITIPGNGYALL